MVERKVKAMNNERLNMGEVVGEMMELIPIQI